MGRSSEKTRAKKGISSEVTRETKATEHQNHELKKETKEDPNVKVCKRKRYTEVLIKEQRDKCQNCVQLNWEIDGLKYEIERLEKEFLELEVRGDLVKVRCNQLKAKILEKETSQREKALEKECAQLNKEVKDLKLGRKRDAVEIEDLKVKCTEMGIQETVLLNHEIELGKKLEAYKTKCQDLSAELERKEMELENQLVVVANGFDQELESYRTRCIRMEEKIKGLTEEGIVVFDREMSAQERICHLEEVIKKMETNERERLAELEAYNFKCQGLSAELEQKEIELENLRAVNGGLDREHEDNMTKCIGMEEQIKGLIEEGNIMSQREKSAQERICHLEEAIKKMETNERERLAELEAYNFKCQGLSAELEQKEMELENLRAVNGGLSRERVDYMTKCIGMEEQIKGLIEEGNVMSWREKSAGERICHLEEVVKKMETDERERLAELETRLLKVEEENATLRALQNVVSCERTCRDMDGRVYAANEAHLTRTEPSPNSTFTLASCIPSSSLQVNVDGVTASDLAHANSQCKSAAGAKDYFASAVGRQGQVGFETQGRLTRFRKCSGIPSSENLALVRQEDGARPSTPLEIVEIDSEEETVDISDNEEEN
ncbi:desmoplakin-like [Papaver somniferum]|uniref:desmoplakin-like n=1 Tax=Papaver somniferum TaxID=3469 RepID=UPI000E6F5756|nr:desmoplakin-like [Papaver somniferum]